MSLVDRRTLMIGAGTGAGLMTMPSGALAANVPLRVSGLRAAGMSDPLGIGDVEPTLSWRIEGPEGTVQAAFQIRVAATAAMLAAGRPDLWDSGHIAEPISTGTRYGGPPLRSRQRCYWQVKVWDANGMASAWSEPATWEMGLLAPEDWGGIWLAVESAADRDDRAIGPRWQDADLPDATHPGRFRLTFTSGAGEAVLTTHTESRLLALMLDGKPMAVSHWNTAAFGRPPAAATRLPLTAGRHVVIAEVAAVGNDKGARATLGVLLRHPGEDGEWHRIVENGEVQRPDGTWQRIETRTSNDDFPWPPTPARLLRRTFRVEGTPRDMRLYVAALGGYRIWINGVRVGDDELQAEPSEYRRHVPYRTYDVTRLLRPGENVVGVIVGDGFYASYQAPDGRYAYGPAPRRIRLMIGERDEPAPAVVTDADWRQREAPVTMSEIYAGEDHDRRAWPDGWTRPGFEAGDWAEVWEAPAPAGILAAPLGPPIRATRTLRPITVRRIGPLAHIVDFGQNFAGRVRLSVDGARGSEVIVTHAEILTSEGALDRRNLRVSRAQDRYVLAGSGPETLEPVFTFQGFRYAQVDGIRDLRLDMVTGVVISSDLVEIGTLTVSSPLIQKLWLNTLWSQRSNFRGNATDCPQRDERLGWTGDAQVFWDTAAFNMDVAGFTRNFTRMIRDDQAPSGAYPVWSPSPKGSWAEGSPTPGWADAGVMLPYVAYLHGGDRAVVDDNWPAMEAYCGGILSANPDGLWRKDRGSDLGDWLALDAVSPGDETTPKDLIATAMLARSLDQLAAMAVWTDRTEAASRWRATAARTRAAFARAFVRADGTIGNGSHTGYILALRLGLVPDAARLAAGERLASEVRRRGTLLTTGFLGTPLALDALVDAGHSSLAIDLLLRTGYPSWGYMVRHGATTMWERWNSDVGDVSMNSFNHYAFGAVCSFLYRRIGGVEPIEPGFRSFRVSPVFDRRIPAAAVSLDSAAGLIQIA